MRDSLVGIDDGAAARCIVADGLAAAPRLAIYRNTFDCTIANALRISYPAVLKLVGAEFFEGAARLFAHERPPHAASLDLYGADFADFLAMFAPAASLQYLPDVARLEWAVNNALHAPDSEALDVCRVAAIDDRLHERIRFVVDPSVSLLRADHPADVIWRAVLAGDDAALAAVALEDGPVRLMVQRVTNSVEIIRVDESTFRVTAALVAGHTLGVALASTGDSTAAAVLADHLAAGRFVGFELSPAPAEDYVSETTA